MDLKPHPSFLYAESETWTPTAQQANTVVQQFGSPTFVYNAEFLRTNFLGLRNELSDIMEIFYSMKANPNIGLTRRLGVLGAGAEVCSLAELHAAILAGIKPSKIIFVGPAKSVEELSASIEVGIYAIVCESFSELADIEAIAGERPGGSQKVRVMLRINPQFTGEGSGLAMSGKPRQFGIDESQLRGSVNILKQLNHIDILGFHIYMGTRYLDAGSVIRNTDNILNLAKTLAQDLEIDLRAVDIGGGLGVPYFKKESAIDLDELVNSLNKMASQFRRDHPYARLIMELGRYLVAGSGVLITRVRDVKMSMGEQFAIADGGTNLHMAAVGIGSFVKRNFPVLNLTSESAKTEVYNVTGPLCTPNDTLAKRIELHKVARGDLLAVLMSGAYGPTASPTGFLSHGYPSEVVLESGSLTLLRQRDNVDDILRPQTSIDKKKDTTRA